MCVCGSTSSKTQQIYFFSIGFYKLTKCFYKLKKEHLDTQMPLFFIGSFHSPKRKPCSRKPKCMKKWSLTLPVFKGN